MNATSGVMPDSEASFGQLAPALTIFTEAGLSPFCDPVGRIAWAKSDAVAAAGVLASNGYAITRVELWCICNEDTYSAVIPYVDGLYGRFDFRQEEVWAPERETWAEYCARCNAWAVSKLPLLTYEPMLTNDYGPDKMRVHFSVLAQTDYE